MKFVKGISLFCIYPLFMLGVGFFIGVVGYFAFAIFSKLLKNKTVAYSIGGAFGILANTVCTIFMLWVFNYSTLAAMFTVIISINFIGELIGAIILVPIYIKILKKVNKSL